MKMQICRRRGRRWPDDGPLLEDDDGGGSSRPKSRIFVRDVDAIRWRRLSQIILLESGIYGIL